ncbi:MAG: hypothetical protein K2X32_12255 [Phycisphaerales bacterium]|nr:hypothetical protein [Phycisphaerales bacterium]
MHTNHAGLRRAGFIATTIGLLALGSLVGGAWGQGGSASISLPISAEAGSGFLVTVSGSNRVYAVPPAGDGKLIPVNLNNDGLVQPLTSTLAFNIAGESFLIPLGNDRWAHVTLKGLARDAGTIEARLIKR